MSDVKPLDIELIWIRIFDPAHIPSRYIEQIKGRDWSVDKFYAYQRDACVQNSDGMLVLNPYNLLYVLCSPDRSVKGFCWMVVDPLSNALVINSFSMDPEYWGKGSSLQQLRDKAIEMQKGAGLDKVYWITRSPKHSERLGFKRSKHVLMEYHGQDIHGSECESNGSGTVDESGPDEVPAEPTTGSCTTSCGSV